MAKKKSKARIVKQLPQTGKTHIKQDRKLKAKKPGVRISASGKKYKETRRNRSDKNSKTRL